MVKPDWVMKNQMAVSSPPAVPHAIFVIDDQSVDVECLESRGCCEPALTGAWDEQLVSCEGRLLPSFSISPRIGHGHHLPTMSTAGSRSRNSTAAWRLSCQFCRPTCSPCSAPLGRRSFSSSSWPCNFSRVVNIVKNFH